MGSDHTVGSAKERVIREHRFDADDVTAETAQKPAVQCFADVCLVDDRASCNVKENGTGLEKCQ